MSSPWSTSDNLTPEQIVFLAELRDAGSRARAAHVAYRAALGKRDRLLRSPMAIALPGPLVQDVAGVEKGNLSKIRNKPV